MSKVALLPLSLCIGCFYLHGDRAIAQVTTDNTTNTEVNQNGSVTEITGGAARGSNLFHSFEDFSVPAGNAAFFDNASDISNIFSRVTGGNVSNIDGTLRTNDANLFLINPAGIMFGAGARLDLGGGSFYGTTAESILFDEGEFSAADTDSSPLLTINAPIGLNFRNEPGDITVLGDGNGTRTPESPIIDTQDALRVDGTATIGIIGGNINFDDATVKTAGGRIEIGSVAAGRVDLVAVESGFSFNYDNITNFDDVLLSGNSVIDASGAGSGNLQVGARNLSLTGSSGLLSATLGAESGGGIDIFAAESIEISGVANNLGLVSTISSLTFPQGTADAGDINLETGSLRLGDRALISTSNLGAGNSGNINITATDTISLAGEGNTSTISTGNLNFNSATDSGLIDITTNSFTASGFSSLSTLNSGLGAGGNIAIEATGDLSLSENSSLLVRGSPGGAISLTGRNLTLNSGGNLIGGVGATNSSDLVSGDITIDLSEDLTINGLDSLFDPSRIENPSLGAGDSGNIEVNARNIRLTNGGVINSFTLNNSDTGSITLNASNDVSISGIGIINIPLLDDTGAVIPDAFQEVPFNSSIRASASPNSMGNGGSVNINAANFTLDEGGAISVSNLGIGDAGDINITVRDRLIADRGSQINSNIGSAAGFAAEGKVGNINLTGRVIELNNEAQIQAGVFTGAVGEPGSIALTATDSISFTGTNSGIFSDNEAGSMGDAGDTELTAPEIFLTRGAVIRSINSGEGDGGNVVIRADNFTLDEEANVVASNNGLGDAGDIDITVSDRLIADRGSQINSNIGSADGFATEGKVGNISLTGRVIELNNEAQIQAGVFTGAVGEPGSIAITATDSISFTGTNSGIFSNNEAGSTGDAGDTELTAPEIFLTRGAEIRSTNSGIGRGGDVIVSADNFTLDEDATIRSSNDGLGDAGDIDITVSDRLIVNNDSRIGSNIGNVDGVSAAGTVGNINLTARAIELNNNAEIQAGVFTGAVGNPGSVSLSATESIAFTGDSEIFSSNDPGSEGDAGDTVLSAPAIFFDRGAGITSSNSGSGSGGDVTINADNLTLERDNVISAETASGTGGTINFRIAENIILRRGNLISAQAANDGNGGNISIDTNFLVAFPNGNNDIVANAQQGSGGNIEIDAAAIFGIQAAALNSQTNDINASSEFSFDGTININTTDINPVQGATELPQNVVEAQQTTAQACQSNRENIAQNGLTINGQGGVPPAPDLPLSSELVLNPANPVSLAAIPPAIVTSQGKIQPARGISISRDGTISLIAYRTDNSGTRIPSGLDCRV